jgi:hypothetical protein
VFHTPGGHRRFSRRDLEQLLLRGRRTAATLGRLGATPERFNRAYRRRYREDVGQGRLLSSLADREREMFRTAGRSLVEALLRHLDAVAETDRASALAEAEEIARGLGRRSHGAGTSLTGSVAIFTAARSPFLEEIGSIGRRRSLSPAELSRFYDDASSTLDRLLVCFVTAYQEAS